MKCHLLPLKYLFMDTRITSLASTSLYLLQKGLYVYCRKLKRFIFTAVRYIFTAERFIYVYCRKCKRFIFTAERFIFTTETFKNYCRKVLILMQKQNKKVLNMAKPYCQNLISVKPYCDRRSRGRTFYYSLGPTATCRAVQIGYG